jgi:probable HAF family extracellular repeat protein
MMPVPAASRSALVALACLAISTAADPPRAEAGAYYSIRDLGTLPGGSWSVARGLNNRGQVIGESEVPGRPGPGSRKVVFEPDGSIREIDSAQAWAASWRQGINDSGRLAGERPFQEQDRLNDINNRGQKIGSDDVYRHGEGWPGWVEPRRALLIDGGRRIDLGTFGGWSSEGFGINEAGDAVGWADGPDGLRKAFLYRDGTMTDLTGLLGGVGSSAAIAINNRGQIIGSAWEIGPFLLDGDRLVDLGEFPMHVSDINDAGQIVGNFYADASNTMRRALLYQDGGMTDLNELIEPGAGWVLEDAIAINEHGQIAGTGMIDGDRRAFLLTPDGVSVPIPDPIPEPAPIALLGLAAGWAVVRRRRRGG